MSTKSTPKFVKVNADDDKKALFRNMGNNHAYAFMWGANVTLASGTTSVVVADDVKVHGYDLATYATVVATPQGNVGNFYFTADTGANTITFHCENAPAANTKIGLNFMLGSDFIVE